MSARILMMISMAVFGTLGIFVKNIKVGSGELALYRAVLAAILIFIYLKVTHQKIDWKKTKKDVFLLLFSGAAIGINWILLFEAYHYTTVSVATLSYYFAPVIVTIVCPILFGEKLTVRQVFCFVMSTIGIVLVTGYSGFKQGTSDVIGILLGLGAAVFYAAVIILNKYIQNISGIHRTLLQFLAAIFVLLPYVIGSGGFHLGALNGTGWSCLLIVGLIHTGVAYCMYFSALKELRGQQAAVLSYVDPLVAVFASVAVLGESLTTMQVVGGAMILGFTLLNEKQ